MQNLRCMGLNRLNRNENLLWRKIPDFPEISRTPDAIVFLCSPSLQLSVHGKRGLFQTHERELHPYYFLTSKIFRHMTTKLFDFFNGDIVCQTPAKHDLRKAT